MWARIDYPPKIPPIIAQVPENTQLAHEKPEKTINQFVDNQDN
jgi:hypothetical protein